MNSLPVRLLPQFGVIATIIVTTFENFLKAWEASGLAHSREVRLDPLLNTEHLIQVLSALPSLINKEPSKPVILTLRTDQDGGKDSITPPEQYDLWISMVPNELRQMIDDPKSKVFVDWPSELIMYVQGQFTVAPFRWEKIGASIHIFESHRVPNTVDGHINMFNALTALPARAFIKYVPVVPEYSDVMLDYLWQALFRFLDLRPVITFWMSKRGEDSRRICMHLGSDGVFGYIPGFDSAAPGQLSIVELLEDKMVIRAMKPTVHTLPTES